MPAASGVRRCPREDPWRPDRWLRELSPWSLGHWIPESLRHRTKETQGTKGSAEDPSAVQGESRLLLRDAEEIQLARI